MDNEIRALAQAEAEAEEVKEFYRKLGMDEKGIDNFFLEIVRTDDTRKVANLKEEELGLPHLPVRTLLELSRDCESIPSLSSLKEDFAKKSEEILGTSLSREGFLIKARITQKKELLDKNKRKMRRGLFGFKKEQEEEDG